MRERAYSDDLAEGVARRVSAKLVRTSTPGIYKRGNGYVVTFYDQAASNESDLLAR